MFYRVCEVKPLIDLKLSVKFDDNTIKEYDVKPLLDKWEMFNSLKIPAMFNCVRVDNGGYGIVWNQELDLSSNELWENGTIVSIPK